MSAAHEIAATGPAAAFAARLQAELPVIETARLRLRGHGLRTGEARNSRGTIRVYRYVPEGSA